LLFWLWLWRFGLCFGHKRARYTRKGSAFLAIARPLLPHKHRAADKSRRLASYAPAAF
jgi:hypothetical protein